MGFPLPTDRLGRSSRLGTRPGDAYVYAMEQLAQPLGLAALIGGTLDYAILIRHRQERREAFRAARDDIEGRVRGLLPLLSGSI